MTGAAAAASSPALHEAFKARACDKNLNSARLRRERGGCGPFEWIHIAASVLFLARGLLSGLITEETVSAPPAPQGPRWREAAAVSRLIGSEDGASRAVSAKGRKVGRRLDHLIAYPK